MIAQILLLTGQTGKRTSQGSSSKLVCNNVNKLKLSNSNTDQ